MKILSEREHARTQTRRTNSTTNGKTRAIEYIANCRIFRSDEARAAICNVSLIEICGMTRTRILANSNSGDPIGESFIAMYSVMDGTKKTEREKVGSREDERMNE